MAFIIAYLRVTPASGVLRREGTFPTSGLCLNGRLLKSSSEKACFDWYVLCNMEVIHWTVPLAWNVQCDVAACQGMLLTLRRQHKKTECPYCAHMSKPFVCCVACRTLMPWLPPSAWHTAQGTLLNLPTQSGHHFWYVLLQAVLRSLAKGCWSHHTRWPQLGHLVLHLPVHQHHVIWHLVILKIHWSA